VPLIVAGPDAFAAQHALVAVEGDVGAAVVDRVDVILLAQPPRLEARFQEGGDAVQLAFAVLWAVLAVDGMRCHQQLERHALQLANVRRVGANDHVLSYVLCARRRRFGTSLYLHQAQAAAGMGRDITYSAEVRYVDARIQRGEEQLLALFRLHGCPIDGEVYLLFSGHWSLSSRACARLAAAR